MSRRRQPGKLSVFLRSSVYNLYFILTVGVFASGVLLAAPLGYPVRLRIAMGWVHANVFALKHICGLEYRIVGAENIPATPGILFSKHQSTFETFALWRHFPGPSFILKRELLWLPFFGWALALVRPTAINRGAGRQAVEQVVQEGTRHLDERQWVVIFPEGTRRPPGAPPRYKIGGAVLAARSGYPVVPMALNTGEFWGRNAYMKYPGTATFVVGPPIPTRGRAPEAILEDAKQWIEARMAEISAVPQQSEPEPDRSRRSA